MFPIRLNKINHWKVVLLLFNFITAVIVVQNFPRKQYLTGWDALHPEFNLTVNLQRSLHSVWQNNYGVGTLVGHGFASLLPHTFAAGFLSGMLPQWAVRPAFILLCYWLGGLGMLVISRRLLKRWFKDKSSLIQLVPWVSLLSAIYYLLNLGTVQHFYLPLEAFVVQFAFLPWFFWTLDRYLTKPSNKDLVWYGIISFLGSTQGFIPSLFLALLIALAFFAVGWILTAQKKAKIFKRWLVLGLVFIGANAYWLLPFIHYLLANTGHFLSAYNNLLSTPDFAAKSAAYGSLADAAFLKSFFLEGRQPSGAVFAPWIEHYSQGWVGLIGWLVFGLIACGWIHLLINRRHQSGAAYTAAGIVLFGFLASSTLPFSWYMQALYQHSALFEQLFRTAFTKFGLLTAFIYSILFGTGVLLVLSNLKLVTARTARWMLLAALTASVAAMNWPVFTGRLFDQQLLVDIPQPYFEVMEYFKQAGPGRIAELPLDCAEGWFSRPWGYYGSGFMWYGIKQPYLSRTFDVWNQDNENFFFEARYALRHPNFAGFDQVLDKYQVRWLYLDRNLIHCRSEQGFDYQQQLAEYFHNNDGYILHAEFDSAELEQPLLIYENTDAPQSYLTAPEDYIVAASQPDGVSRDLVYRRFGDYIVSNNNTFVFPFKDLELKAAGQFTGRPRIEAETVVIERKLDRPGQLLIPAYADSERVVPIKVTLTPTAGEKVYQGRIELLNPLVYVDGKLVNSSPTLEFGPVTVPDLSSLRLATDNIAMSKVSSTEFIGSLYMQESNNLLAVDGNRLLGVWWESDNEPQLQGFTGSEQQAAVKQGSRVRIEMPKVFDQTRFGNVITSEKFPAPVDCALYKQGGVRYEQSYQQQQSLMRLISVDDQLCLRVPLNSVHLGNGYVIRAAGQHKAGLMPRYRVSNWRGITYAEGYFQQENHSFSRTLLLPPVFSKDLQYRFDIRSTSYGQQKTVNDIKTIEYWFFPYGFTSQLQVYYHDSLLSSSLEAEQTEIEPPLELGNYLQLEQITNQGELKYRAAASAAAEPGLLVLLQGYHPGWKAYVLTEKTGFFAKNFPGLFAQELFHQRYNNWANVWKTPAGEYRLLVVYQPQIWQQAGFLALIFSGGVLAWLLWKQIRRDQV